MTPFERKIEALKLFDTLVKINGPEREPRLLALAQSDPELAHEVQRLLDAEAAETDAREQSLQGLSRTVLTTPAAESLNVSKSFAARLEVGSLIGSFTLLRPVGQGGMGEVWLAERRMSEAAGDFVQQVALKLLKRGMDSEILVRRFVQERRILAELNHPHIARFIDGGISADGRLYYAMEFVEGVSITEYARHHKLDARARVQLMSEVCDAVAHAQTRLVVHRDLKPSNILVDKNAQPRVLDFGIAKLLDSSESDQTATEMRAMTLGYAAPEQILGESISTATDVYALGVILYELLTGTLPHQRRGTLANLADTVRLESIERPSAALRRGNIETARAAREIAGDLDTVLLMALRQEPARRYANAAAFGSDLQAWLADKAVAAQPDTRGYRARTFVRRNRVVVGGASAVFLALGAGLSAALWQAGVAREQTAQARAQSAIAQEASTRTERVKAFMMQIFVSADPMRNAAAKPATLAEAFDAALTRIDSDLKDDPKLQIDVLDDFSEILANQGRAEQALPLINRALKLAEATYPSNSPIIAGSLANRAAINHALDQPSIPDLERAVAILEPHALAMPLQLSGVLNSLCTAYSVGGDPSRASPICDRMIAIFRQSGNETCFDFGGALYNAGTVKIRLGLYLEAESLLREAERLCTELSGEKAMPLVYILGSLADIEFRKGRMDVVMQINQRRLSILGEVFLGDHELKAKVFTALGKDRIEQQPLEAIQNLDQAIAMYERMGSRWVVLPLLVRARAALKLQGDAAAMPFLDRALGVCMLKQMDHINCDEIRANRAAFIARLGNGKLALAEVQAAMQAIEKRGQASESEYAGALESKAIALIVLNRKAEATTAQNDAIARYQELFGNAHPETIRARSILKTLGEPRNPAAVSQ